MTFVSQKYHRRSIRLKGYDYSQAGAYYITVCVQDRACLFGEVGGDVMHLNDAGRMVLAEWDALPARFPAVELDAFVVMPNHVHGIFVMTTSDTVTPVGQPLWLPSPRLPWRSGNAKRLWWQGRGQPQDRGQPQGLPLRVPRPHLPRSRWAIRRLRMDTGSGRSVYTRAGYRDERTLPVLVCRQAR